ncbi:MAG: glycoside hydrolase family 28 protein [Candidatus Sumerlaeota bacterium]|nr:glycoside hydrolase family 28 protein [Candidatus Sumerlaeota bacterium]
MGRIVSSNRMRIFLSGILALWIVGLGATAERRAYSAPIPSCFNVVEYGAAGDGNNTCTKSIQAAIEACAAAGGGVVHFPAGRYLTGPVFLKSNITLHIGEGATLLGSQRFEDFPLFKPGWQIKNEKEILAALITGSDLENIAITGRGAIDAQGKPWWDAQRRIQRAAKGQAAKSEAAKDDAVKNETARQEASQAETAQLEEKLLPHGRPHTINLYRCRNVRIAEVTILNSASWNVHLIGCEDVVADGVTIRSPWDSPNTDGINPESCRNVRIANCFIDTGDDCITLKSGKDEEGRLKGKPTENVAITNCVMHRGHGAVVIGSEQSGGVRNVVASNIVCLGTDTGVRIKSTRGRGGVVENIRFDNWIIEGVPTPISITNYYTKTAPEPVSERTPIFREIAISHFTITSSPCVAKILGLPEMPIQSLRISDLMASTQKGFTCDSVDGLELRNLRITTKEGPAFQIANCRQIELDSLQCPQPLEGQPVIRLENAEDAFIHGCRAWNGTGAFLEILGEKTKGITLIGNHLSAARKTFVVQKGAREDAVVEK